MLIACFLVLLSYLVGSVPWGLVIAKVVSGIDPRTAGSHSIGATNVSRLCGFHWGLATLVCDILKGTVPVCLALWLDVGPVGVSCVAASAVLGHVFSCFLHFTGGKAVATSIGVFLPLAFFPLASAALLCLLLIAITGFVSVGSLTLVSSLPLFLAYSDPVWLPLAVFLGLLVFWKHRENLARLRSGTEKSWLKSRQTEPRS